MSEVHKKWGLIILGHALAQVCFTGPFFLIDLGLWSWWYYPVTTLLGLAAIPVFFAAYN